MYIDKIRIKSNVKPDLGNDLEFASKSKSDFASEKILSFSM